MWKDAKIEKPTHFDPVVVLTNNGVICMAVFNPSDGWWYDEEGNTFGNVKWWIDVPAYPRGVAIDRRLFGGL